RAGRPGGEAAVASQDPQGAFFRGAARDAGAASLHPGRPSLPAKSIKRKKRVWTFVVRTLFLVQADLILPFPRCRGGRPLRRPPGPPRRLPERPLPRRGARRGRPPSRAWRGRAGRRGRGGIGRGDVWNRVTFL